MDPLEQRLLEAARHDHIPDALSARMAEALGVQAAGAALQASVHLGAGASTSAELATPLLTKTGLWGALALAGAIGVASFQLWPRADDASQPTPGTAPSTAPPSALPAAATPPATTRERTEPRAAEPRATVLSARPAAAEVVRSASIATRALDRPDDSALRAEVTLLDRARNALHDGASARALRLLDQHAKRFAHPTLAPEADALRIEALVQRGEGSEADALSQRFAASYPTHPLRARVAALRARGARAAASAPAPVP